ncbi:MULTISPECIES: glycosyl hydrolase family 18 protein [Bacillus]|uniref:glycosyl hydrolase family 18 protein n=1 Tax=Bacillus TaxID=1386 RepID=UPI0015E0C49B|nr:MULTISPECIES: glycosyl hydrolase family 18 protein [Bacillus]
MKIAILQREKRKQLSKKWIAGGLLLACLMVISSVLLLLYPFASKVKDNHFIGDNPILFKGAQAGNAIIEGESVYVPVSFMNSIEGNIAYDQKSNSIIIATKDKVVQMPGESQTIYENGQPVELQFPAVTAKSGELHVALDAMLAYFPIQFKVLQESNAVWIQQDGQHLTRGVITGKDAHAEKLRLRTKASLQSAYVAKTIDQEPIYIEKATDDYLFVRNESGIAGYIEKDLVKETSEEVVTIARDSNNPVLPQLDGPVQLTWEAVYTKNPDTNQIPAMPGVNVVSPTWFELTSADGAVKNLASIDYVNWARNRGYHVWGLFSNAFNPELTHSAFKDFETRQKIIRQLLNYSQTYQLAGINLDIENVNEADGPLVTQFVREATAYFHQAGLVVSMDITFISGGNWSAFYERDKLANIVDYMIVMAYDEHWASSEKAGSVASFPWVEQNLSKLLDEVPKEQLILGVPLYARLWKEQVLAGGNVEVTSTALSMNKVKEWLITNKIQPTYDPDSGQNYAEYYNEAEQATYKIWLEDELSLRKRTEMAAQYELAGVASWSRYFADEAAWTALQWKKDNNITKK